MLDRWCTTPIFDPTSNFYPYRRRENLKQNWAWDSVSIACIHTVYTQFCFISQICFTVLEP